MLEPLSVARHVVSDGHEVVPAWRIETPDRAWLILTRCDPDKPGQSDRALYLVRRFMAWKRAAVVRAGGGDLVGHQADPGVLIEPSAIRDEAVSPSCRKQRACERTKPEQNKWRALWPVRRCINAGRNVLLRTIT